MILLIYASSETHKLSEENLLEILKKARTTNHKLGITGMLLYHGGNFLQVLEGSESEVEPLYNKIKLDPRHTGVTLIVKRKIQERSFSEWSMGFVDVSKVDPTQIEGYSNFLNEPLTGDHLTENPSLADVFLSSFRSFVR